MEKNLKNDYSYKKNSFNSSFFFSLMDKKIFLKKNLRI